MIMLGFTYILRPDADKETKAMLAPTLLPDLLQLGSAKGLELALPSPQNHKEERTQGE